jgi:hypothetical protein
MQLDAQHPPAAEPGIDDMPGLMDGHHCQPGKADGAEDQEYLVKAVHRGIADQIASRRFIPAHRRLL